MVTPIFLCIFLPTPTHPHYTHYTHSTHLLDKPCQIHGLESLRVSGEGVCTRHYPEGKPVGAQE